MSIFVQDADFTLYHGDALEVLSEMADGSVNCCVTSPPYWGLRDYGHGDQLGLESTPDEYVARLVDVFREVRRVLRDDGTLWLNLGDTYNTSASGTGGSSGLDGTPNAENPSSARRIGRYQRDLKPKDLVGIPWRVAFALQAEGWYLRSDIIWAKPNPMPESVTDRPTKAHEYVFLLSKSAAYYWDQEAVREPLKQISIEREGRNRFTPYDVPGQTPQRRAKSGNKERTPNPAATLGNGDTKHGIPWEDDGNGRNVRSVWEIPTQPYAEAHFATFPQELARRCILAGSPERGVVLDPFLGSGTTALVARNHGRRSIGIELNPDYCDLAAKRLSQQTLLAYDS